MDPITATIRSGDTGAAVANLQDALVALLDKEVIRALDSPSRPTQDELTKLAEALNRERAASTFGAATQQLVQYFQIQQRLYPEETWDQELPAHYRGVPVGDNNRGVVEEKTAAKLTELLDKLGLLDGGSDTNAEQFLVKGQVTDASGKPAGGVVVRAFDRDLRRCEPLGEQVITPEDGSYKIHYSRSQFVRAEQKSNAYLVVRVFRAEDGSQDPPVLAESETLFNAPAAAEVNLQLKATAYDRSDYERLVEAILPRLIGQATDGGNLPLTELTADDIDFLSRDTGIEDDHIRLLVEAAKLADDAAASTRANSSVQKSAQVEASRSSAISPPVFYGWFRLGLPTVAKDLWKNSTDELMKKLVAAIAQRLIPAISAADQKLIRQAIEQLQQEQLLQDPLPGSQAGLGDLLGTMPSSPDPNQQRALASAMGNLQPDDPRLVEKIGAVAGFDGDAAAVARTLRLGNLTGGQIALTKALQGRLQDAKDADGSLRPLAAIPADEWIDLAYTHVTPDEGGPAPDELAIGLSAQVERQQPTAALARQLGDGSALSQHPLLTDVGTFLTNNPTFDIVSANLNAVQDEPKLQGVGDPEQLVRGLRALQRFNSLGASWSDTATLMQNELYSPQHLLDAGPAQLSEMLDGQLPPERIAALHDQAEELHNVTFAAVSSALSPLSGPNVLPGGLIESSGTEPPAEESEPSGEVGLKDLTSQLKARQISYDPGKYKSLGPIDESTLKDIRNRFKFDDVVAHQPTLQALFGSQDACTCYHCSSVLSPAAYFADLLQFIRKAAPNGWLLERLLHRRPDLQDIELTCSNSNTEVPAIDLALEILENAVALPLAIDLPTGTTLDQELRDKQPVGATIRTALERTVRHFAGDGVATWVGANGDGTADWTVVDLHRRWTLTILPKEAFVAQDGIRGSRTADFGRLNTAALIRSLDKNSVPKGAEEAFVRLIAPKQKSDISNYHVTVTTLTAGHMWRIAYYVAAELVVNADRSELTLRTPGGKAWLNKSYDKKTIAALQKDLANKRVPELARVLFTSKFPDAGTLTIKPGDSRREDVWSISSAERAIKLTYTPASLHITSLAYQSGDDNADPIAEPENHNPEAYVRLKDASFPWTLPLDLPLEEVRVFLERARSSRRELIEGMLPVDVDVYSDATQAAEVLGLSAAEATLIDVASASPELYDHWGIPETQNFVYDASTSSYVRGTPPLALLKNVSVMLQQSRVSFDELETLIETQFVTLAGKAVLNIAPRTSCKPSEMSLVELTTGHLDRLHRFIRLWHRLGWTIHELDLAIQVFAGSLKPETLISLAGLKKLKEETGLSVTVLVGALDRLETHSWTDYQADGAPERPPMYDTIFQSEAVRKLAAFADFGLRPDRSELQNTPNAGISGHAEYISNCIGVDADVVAAWTSTGNALGIVDKLDLANLSRVTAAANICAALSIEPAQLAHYLSLLGNSPFRTNITVGERLGSMVDFVDRFRKVAKSGIDAETLRYLLEHYIATDSDVPLSALQLTQIAATARDAVRSIADAPAPQSAAVLAATQTAREDAVIAALATGVGGVLELVDELLRNRLKHPSDATKLGLDALLADDFTTADVAHMPTAPIPPATTVAAPVKAKVDAADKAVGDLIMRLYKAVFISNALKYTAERLDLLSTSTAAGDAFTGLDFNTLPVAASAQPADFSAFEQLLALSRLRAIAPGGADLLHRYIVPADSAAWSAANARQVLATGFELPESEVKAAADQLHITTDEQYRDPQALERLVKLLVILKKIGEPMALALDLTTASSPDEAAALAARELLRGKFGDSQWHDLIKPVEDKLRERQRNALVDFLIFRDRLHDANDLYENYLIDVQTCSCMNTTRLLQATAAVQLFVQRVLLKLEPGASLSSDKRELWDWMQSYRVWEANRKVFLFPENWLLPELRDDKTAIFRDLESALSESEPSPDSMRAALLTYLDGLGELAQISVVAMYEDRQLVGDPPGQKLQSTLYVIGRTTDQPHRYLWRLCAWFGDSARMSWSGWEPLDLDNANDFIMPFVFEGDLHVAWPVFRKTKGKDDENQLEWEIQLAWSRRTSKGWTKRKLSAAVLGVNRLPNKDEAGSFAFRLVKNLIETGYLDEDGNPLMRESLLFRCFAAQEINSMITTRADASVDLLTHSQNMTLAWYNTKLTITGVVFDYATVDQENTVLKRPLNNIPVTAYYSSRFRANSPDGDVKLQPPVTKYTDGNGEFTIVIDVYDGQGNNDNKHGVFNGSAVRLVAGLADGDSPVTERFSKDLTDQNSNHFDFWAWRINIGVEHADIRSQFLPDRPVNYSDAGSFILESGADIRLELANGQGLPQPRPNLLVLSSQPPLTVSSKPVDVDENGFSAVDEASTIANVELGADGVVPSALIEKIEAPVYVTPAFQSAPSPGVTASYGWYLQDKRGGYYLLKQGSDWACWPDGQRFTSDYRIVASLADRALFRREIEGRLQDALTDNFSRAIPYANYNWELFLHVPLAIADFMLGQQRFDDARRWLHAVLDPTTDDVMNGVPQYWRFLPFSNASQPDAIAKLLTWLADPSSGDPKVENALNFQIEQWRENPFMPHLIARLRPSAYQWYAFFAYLDVLIQWGDQLFRRDTRESVNEATLLYVLAAKMLGPRPRTIRAPASLPPQTYRLLSANALDDFSNAWIQYADLAGVRKLIASAKTYQNSKSEQAKNQLINKQVGSKNSQTSGIKILTSFGLSFCIPQNDKITGYYNLIEKRLFDIRHCRNIEGVFRELPLYDPPIDPLLLIRARAAGLDIATVIADMYAPLPNYRFVFTLQKAVEFCSEVKSLGSALLSALEKQDAEELSLLRSGHEIGMLKLARDVRKKQVDEADANIVALQQSQATVTERFNQFQKLLGKTSITKGQDSLPVVEQSTSLSVSTDPVGGASGLGLSRMEVDQLRYSALAHLYTQTAGAVQVVAGVISLFPNIFAGTPFAGQTSGGTNFGIGANAIAKSIEMIAAEANYLASQAGTFGGYERRQDEWVYQSRLALAELKQFDKQILAAQIRKSIAQKELDNHDQQIENAKAIDDFMRSKFTNQQLFKWMSSQIAEVYFRTYQLALDQAKRAERAFQRELGLDQGTAPYVQSDNWDSLKRGLLAGERLHNDLKRMESAYLEHNVREYEITRQVSLLQLDPMALISLRESGSCTFSIPEALFDLDCPGHYMRRIKMVSLSIPCVAGGYASVSATLRLKENHIRVTSASENYAYLVRGQGDPHFSSNTAPTMAIVTSNSQQDSGMFEPNLRDDRYLPFEGAGVISTWEIELPDQFRQFDYDTISDVILHVRYTSRAGGPELKDAATAYLSEQIGKAEASGMVRLFSIRHEFPSAWAKFIATDIDGTNVKSAELSLELRPEHYPFWSRGRLKSVKEAVVIAKVADGLDDIEIDEKPDGTGKSDTLTDLSVKGVLKGELIKLKPSSPVSAPDTPLKLFFKQNSMDDLWIAVTWKGAA
jgi:hypothetical protein